MAETNMNNDIPSVPEDDFQIIDGHKNDIEAVSLEADSDSVDPCDRYDLDEDMPHRKVVSHIASANAAARKLAVYTKVYLYLVNGEENRSLGVDGLHDYLSETDVGTIKVEFTRQAGIFGWVSDANKNEFDKIRAAGENFLKNEQSEIFDKIRDVSVAKGLNIEGLRVEKREKSAAIPYAKITYSFEAPKDKLYELRHVFREIKNIGLDKDRSIA